MTNKNLTQLSQELIEKYFKGWISVSVYVTPDYNRRPSNVILDFDSCENVISSYEFLRQWKDYPIRDYLTFSIIIEPDNSFSFYFFTPDLPYFKKANFGSNINKDKIIEFSEKQKHYNFFGLLPRYADESFNIIDSYTNDIILLSRFRYLSRNKLSEQDYEFNK